MILNDRLAISVILNKTWLTDMVDLSVSTTTITTHFDVAFGGYARESATGCCRFLTSL